MGTVATAAFICHKVNKRGWDARGILKRFNCKHFWVFTDKIVSNLPAPRVMSEHTHVRTYSTTGSVWASKLKWEHADVDRCMWGQLWKMSPTDSPNIIQLLHMKTTSYSRLTFSWGSFRVILWGCILIAHCFGDILSVIFLSGSFEHQNPLRAWERELKFREYIC